MDLITKEPGGPFWCHACPYTARHKIQIVRHVETKHFTLGYRCEACDRVFKTNRDLYLHRNRFHGAADPLLEKK